MHADMIIITDVGRVDGMCGSKHCMYNMCVLPLCNDIIIVLMPLVGCLEHVLGVVPCSCMKHSFTLGGHGHLM